MNTSHTEWAKAALLAFMRRTFTQLAIAAEKDAKTFRSALKGLRS